MGRIMTEPPGDRYRSTCLPAATRAFMHMMTRPYYIMWGFFCRPDGSAPAGHERSKGLAVAEPAEPPPQPVEMVRRRDSVGRRSLMGQHNLRLGLRRMQLLSVVVIGCAATSAGSDKSSDALGFAGKGPIRLQLGHFEGGALEAPTQHPLPPIQTGLFQFPGMPVRA